MFLVNFSKFNSCPFTGCSNLRLLSTLCFCHIHALLEAFSLTIFTPWAIFSHIFACPALVISRVIFSLTNWSKLLCHRHSFSAAASCFLFPTALTSVWNYLSYLPVFFSLPLPLANTHLHIYVCMIISSARAGRISFWLTAKILASRKLSNQIGA